MITKIVKIILPLMIIATGTLATLMMLKQRTGPQLKPIQPKQVPIVQVMQTQKYTGSIFIKAHATTEAKATYNIASEVSGKVIWVNPAMKEGGKIELNAPLFKIDPIDYQLKVQQAKASLMEAQYNLDLAKAQQNAAIKEFEAYRKTSIISGKTDNGNDLSKLAKYEPQVESAMGALESAKAASKIAELELERTTVYSPSSGYFSTVSVNRGQIISENETVAKLINTEPIILKPSISLSDLQWLSLEENLEGTGQASTVTISKKVGSTLHQWQGSLKRTLREIDSSSKKAVLIIEVNQVRSDHDLDLPIGLFVEVTLQGQFNKDVVGIPVEALRQDSTVWTVNAGNSLDIQSVTIEKRTDQMVYISNGLEAGENLITSSMTAPIPGMAIRILDSDQKVVESSPLSRSQQRPLSELALQSPPPKSATN